MKPVLTLLLCVLLFSCSNSPSTTSETTADQASEELPALPAKTNTFDWLLGNWQRVNEKSDSETYETWAKVDDNHYKGIGYTLSTGDTSFFEQLFVEKSTEGWVFKAIPPGATQPTTFPMTTIEANRFVVENEQNDFPKKIVYELDGEMLKATISDSTKAIPFHFNRIAELPE